MAYSQLFRAPALLPEVLPEYARTPTPDVLHYSFTRLGVKEAARLHTDATLRPVEASARTLVVFAKACTLEGQNALLKLVEDPPHNAAILLLTPDTAHIIPTLRSRFVLVSEEAAPVSATLHSETEKFLHSSYRERLTIIERLHKAKRHDEMAALAGQLVRYVAHHALPPASKAVAGDVAALLNQRGVPQKYLLEHLALELPVGEERLK